MIIKVPKFIIINSIKIKLFCKFHKFEKKSNSFILNYLIFYKFSN